MWLVSDIGGPYKGICSWWPMMIVLFIVLARNKLRIPLEGTYSREM